MNLTFYNEIKKICSDNSLKLVAVSKTKPSEDIKLLYEKGQRIFGENKVQELVEKHNKLPKDIAWHFIGHLQKNKVKYIAPFVSLVHAVDSLSLLKEIDKRALQNNRKIDCLVQIHIAQEQQKFGLQQEEIASFFEQAITFNNVNIVGLMGMATFTQNHDLISTEFSLLKHNFDQIKTSFYKNESSFCELSMGMSGDYKLATKHGSTMLRIGSAIFGSR